MATPIKVVALSGGTFRPSRTLALTQAIVAELEQSLQIDAQLIELADIARPLGNALARKELSAEVEAVVSEIESADLLIAAAPVYRGSYPGSFKHLFDLVHQEALIGTPVLLAATGGSERHALVIDHQLRPLFSFFQAITLPLGVYASEADFTDYHLSSEALKNRVRLAVERTIPLFDEARHPVLNIA